MLSELTVELRLEFSELRLDSIPPFAGILACVAGAKVVVTS